MCAHKITSLGEKELLNRELNLPTRAYTLLIITSTRKVPNISLEMLERIASAENFQILEDLGLLK